MPSVGEDHFTHLTDIQLWFNGRDNFGLTEVDRNDLSETNSKLKGPN